jgi:AcrR family transcriptional regulator
MSVTDENVRGGRVMAKSGEARRRLQQAALELFGTKGFDLTTAAEIAEKAGVTERTFFRYFADKRDVLFDGETALADVLTASMREAPAEMGPWDVLFRAFAAAEYLFVENREFTLPRHAVIQSDPALQERALAKTRSLTASLDAALRERGVSVHLAMLAAQVGMAAMSHAVASWFEDGSRNLSDYLVDAFREVRDLSAAPPVSTERAGPANGRRSKIPK